MEKRRFPRKNFSFHFYFIFRAQKPDRIRIVNRFQSENATVSDDVRDKKLN
jgi:hypothetical protein